MEFVQLIENITHQLRLMFLEGFNTSRDPQKSYEATFRKSVELSRDESPPVMDGSVDVDPAGAPVVEQL